MTYGIDVSNYGIAPNQAALSQVVNSLDIQHLTIAAQFPATYQGWFDCARALGIPTIDAYLYCYNTNPNWAEAVGLALNNMAFRMPTRLWLDIEDPNPPAGIPARIEAAIQAAISGGVAVGIYTSPGYWAQLGNPQLGSRLPLWLALWDGQPQNLDVNFGGWMRAHGKQYAGELASYGVVFDQNWWDE